MAHGILCRSTLVLLTLNGILYLTHTVPVVQHTLRIVNFLLTLCLCLVVLIDAGVNFWKVCRGSLPKCRLCCLNLCCYKLITFAAG